MLLKNTIDKLGDFCFDKRGLQFLPYIFVILLEFKSFTEAKECVPFEILCFAITFAGILIRILTIAYVPEGTSGRNRGTQIAETLNTKGAYSVVRNPLYVGNFFIFLGITMMTQNITVIIFNSLLMLVIYSLIVLREENFLLNKFGETYRNWCERVNCFIPSFKNFEKTERKFSLKKVIKNEHDTWLTTVAAFMGIEVLKGYFEVHTFFLIPIWTYIGIGTVVLWFISKRMKKAQLLN